MLVEIESIKELKPGYTYALQLPKGLDREKIYEIDEYAKQIERAKGISFILIQTATLVDAPVPVESEKKEP